MRISDRYLTRKTEDLLLPSYSAFKKADTLLEELIDLTPVEDWEQIKIDQLFMVPGLYQDTSEVDSYLFSTSIALSLMVIATKELYRKSDLEFCEELFLDNSELESRLPTYKFLEIRGMGRDADLEDLCMAAAERIVEALETLFYGLENYNPDRASTRIEKKVRSIVGIIGVYAEYGLRIAEIIDGYGQSVLAGSLAVIMKKLMDGRRLYRYLQYETHQAYCVNDLFKWHAQSKGLAFNDNVFAFAGMIGEEITVVANLAVIIKDYETIGSDLFLSDKKNLFVPLRKSYCVEDKRDKISMKTRKAWATNRVELLGESIMEEEDHILNMMVVKSPCDGLSQKLHAFGIPYQTAKQVGDYLSFNLLDRSLSTAKIKPFDRISLYKELYGRGDNFAVALSEFIGRLVGKNPVDIVYKHFSGQEDASVANGVGTIVYVYALNGNKSKKIEEYWSRFDEKRELKRAHDWYGSRGNDIYIYTNVGICLLLEEKADGYCANPERSIIETKECGHDISCIDKLAGKLFELFVDCHEMIHACQIDSRLIYRGYAASWGHFYSKWVRKAMKKGWLNIQSSNQYLNVLLAKGMTLKQTIVHYLDLITIQSCGAGRLADNLRQLGIFNGMLRHGVDIDYRGNFDTKKLSSKTRLKDSAVTADLSALKKAIMEEDTVALRRLEKEFEKKEEEFHAIMETMADTFALAAMKEFIDKLPDRRYRRQERKNKYFSALYAGACRKGMIAKRFLDIWAADISHREKIKALAKIGLIFQQTISREKHHDPVRRRLILLGYNPLDPLSAYEDMAQLRKTAASKGVRLRDVMYPYNLSVASIGSTYSVHIPLFMKVIERFGVKIAFKKLLESESIAQIEMMVK